MFFSVRLRPLQHLLIIDIHSSLGPPLLYVFCQHSEYILLRLVLLILLCNKNRTKSLIFFQFVQTHFCAFFQLCILFDLWMPSNFSLSEINPFQNYIIAAIFICIFLHENCLVFSSHPQFPDILIKLAIILLWKHLYNLMTTCSVIIQCLCVCVNVCL